MSRRQRRVFPNREIPHLWAHQTQDEASNGTGSFYFRGATIYSYGSHFPIATFVKGSQGQPGILFISEKYSVTTSQHMSMVHRSIPPGLPVFTVPCQHFGVSEAEDSYQHEKNFKHYARQVAEHIATCARARSSYNKEHHHEQADELRKEALCYATFFGLPNPAIDQVPDLDSEQMAGIKAREARTVAKKAAETKRREEEDRVRWAQTTEQWRRGECHHYLPYSLPTMLRIEGYEVVTSRGARFPITQAKRTLALVRGVIARAEDWRRNGQNCRLGHYHIDWIEADGTVHAGCHVVTWQEIERVAPDIEAYEPRLKCNQCMMLSINGIPCHETGCPNSSKSCSEEDQDWIEGEVRRMNKTVKSGQAGTVVLKGRWWTGRYYEDVPGQMSRKRKSIPIGLKSEMKKPEARRKLRAMLEEMGVNTVAHFGRSLQPVQSFSEHADWWEKNVQPMHQPSSANASHYILKKHLRPKFGDMPLDSISQESVQEWIADLQREGKLKPRSIRNVWKVLRLILGKKRVKDWTVRLPKNPKKEQRWFTVEEMERIIDAAWSQYKYLFRLARATGMRSGELFGLRVEDLDLEKAIVQVQRSAWHHLEVTPKTDAGHRDVDIDAETVRMLKGHLGDRKTGLVFPSRNNTPLVNRNINVDVLRVICKRLEVPNGGMHAFRHGRISELQAKGVPGDLIARWVGHANLKITSLYTHFSEEFRKETIAKLDSNTRSKQL